MHKIALCSSVFALLSGCLYTPENDGGLRSKATPVELTGYMLGRQPPFDLSVQQKTGSGTWTTTRTVSAASNGAGVALADGTWYPFKATVVLSSDASYWLDAAFGGIVHTRLRARVGDLTLSNFKDNVIGSACATPYFSAGGLAVMQNCMQETQGELVLNTCKQLGGVFDCGPAGYPTALQRQVIAALSGRSQLGAQTLTGRFTEPQRAAVRSYLLGMLAELGGGEITAELDPFTGADPSQAGANVLGWLPCEAAGCSNQLVVVGAHFDSASQFSPGALDNAAGVAVMLDAAKHLAALPSRSRHVLFAAFDSHEGRMRAGSRHLADLMTQWEASGRYDVHSTHMADELGDKGPRLFIEAPNNTPGNAALTDCMWAMYQETNTVAGLGIPLQRFTDALDTDHNSMLARGFRGINVTEGAAVVTGYHHQCLQGRSCDPMCGGDCSQNRFCTAEVCGQPDMARHCLCDVYDNLEPTYLASISMLVRKTVERVATRQTSQCD